MTVTLVALCARGDGQEIEACFEIRQGEEVQRERLPVSAALCADLGLKKGELTPEGYDRVLEASRAYLAQKKAMGCLAYGRCSRRRLVQKLSAKGVERRLAEETARHLEAEGYLAGEADTLREAQRGAEKGWGEKRIAADLRAKGYADGHIRAALAELRAEGVSYAEACARQIRRRWGSLPTESAERQKAMAALCRLGFSGADIRAAVQMLNR